MFNCIKVDYQLSNELKMKRIVTPMPSPKKIGSETRIRCFTSKTHILSIKTLLESFFALKPSHKVHTSLLMPPWGGPKCNFVHDFAHNAARISEIY